MPNHSPPLVITDGGLGGLLACWAEGVCARSISDTGAGAPVGYLAAPHPPVPGALAAAGRQLELCHLADLVARDHAAGTDDPDPFALTRLLIDAVAAASARGLARIVWPVHAGGSGSDTDLDAVAAACDRAMLITHLAELDLPAAPRIETPYADYTDRQMAEIALDMDAPLAAAWWCRAPGDRACGGCEPCRRWAGAFDAARRGVPPENPGSTTAAVVTMGPRPRTGGER